MNLWIRTQENKAIRNMLLKVDTLELGDFNAKEECIVANNLYCIGIYKNKERALEVLDEIQRILKPKIFVKYNEFGEQELHEKITQNVIYEMPKE